MSRNATLEALAGFSRAVLVSAGANDESADAAT